MIVSSGSIFKTFFIPKAVNVKDKDFVKRLEKLEQYILKHYEVEVIPTGWKCTSKSSTLPGYVITQDSVLFVMKNLGI